VLIPVARIYAARSRRAEGRQYQAVANDSLKRLAVAVRAKSGAEGPLCNVTLKRDIQLHRVEGPVRSVTNYRPRQAPRRKLKIPVIVFLENGERITQAHTLDVSQGGAKLKLDRSVDLPEQFLITLSERGEVQRLCRLVWRTAGEIGVRFIEPARPGPASKAAKH
jgi:hypothetical protein